ncbi:MAG: FAD-linked oxidase C-terminal domain-containing protein [Planctomycetia bacterium]|nr:FAD-linked oxidase C-terminal domain-containing protein [Planctomycetia bacterium]
MLDPRGERIQDDLRGILKGEVHCHTIDTQPFATDASIYEKRPLCVVFPRTTMDIVATVRYARSQKLSIHPRGGGSGCVGGALGEGIVLDLSRFMRRILTIHKNVLKVQAGAQCALLQGYLRHSGRTIGSCGRNSHAKTIGGMLAVDGYGSHWLSGGRPSDWLLGLEMVTANGTILSFTREEKLESWKMENPTSEFPFLATSEEPRFSEYEKKRLITDVANVLRQEEEFLQTTKSHHVIDKMGYRLDGLHGNTLDMARLIAGSEGTLGIITTATLQLQQMPAFRQSTLFLFENMEKATLAIPYILQYHPDACEWIDRRHLHLAAEQDVRFDVMFPSRTEVALLLDFSHEKQYNLRNQLRNVADLLIHQKELAFAMIPACDEAESALFWKLTDTLYPTVQRHVKNPVRIPFVEDVAVPPQQLRELILKIQELLRQYEMTASLHAHAGQGQIRLLPLGDLHSPRQIARLLRFTEAYYTLVRQMGGSIGAENGIGLGRVGWLPFFQGKRYEINQAIKKIFDPEGIFQPGKLGSEISAPQPTHDGEIPFLRSEFVRNQIQEETPALENPTEKEDSEDVLGEGNVLPNERDPSGILVMEQVRQILGNYFDEEKEDVEEKNLSRTEEKEGANLAQAAVEKMGLDWDVTEMGQTAFQCNGCADCRGMERETRSCPVFRLSHNEYASPRAKVNLLNGFLTGQLELSEVGETAFHDILQQCFQCHACRTECPAQVDVPFLVRRSQEAWARVRGHNFYETAMARLENWLAVQYRFASVTHFLFANPWFRWFFEKTFGIARQRHFPPVEFRSFLDQIRNLPPAEGEERPFFQENQTEIRGKVVYFLDTCANYLDTSLAHATVGVFTHNDIPILVPQHQSPSGLTSVMLGRNNSIRKQVARNAAILADYVRQGYDVILTEPSVTLAFRWEYPQTFPENEDVALVAKHVYDAGEYLYKLHLLQQLRLPRKPLPLSLGYHAPCRLLALKIGLPFVHLLRLIPQLEIEISPAGCCGMGGTFGMQAAHYPASLRIGRPLHTWLRYPTLQAGVTECTACKLQMEHKTTKPILHPMKILAQSYGRCDR